MKPPSRRRERILVYGPSGSGKSTSWTTIAEWINRTKSSARMHVMDTDAAWEAMCPLDGHLDSVVTVYDCPTWEDTREAVRQIVKVDKSPDDWLVLDMADKPWSQAQEAYFARAYGVEIDEFFVAVKGDTTKMGGEWGVNWQAVNKMYGTVSQLIQSRWPGHVIATSPAHKLWKDQKTDLLVTYPEFGRIGFHPQGQKDLPHLFHTILYLTQGPSGWWFRTAKERNPAGAKEGDDGFRRYVDGEQVRDFFRDYLMKVGGWRP